MSRDLTRRYIWLIDLLTRRGPLTRAEISDEWQRAAVSDGNPLPPRSFFHFRRAIEENFNIDILCNSLHEYYIDEPRAKRDRVFRNWLLDSFSLNSAFGTAGDLEDKVLVEDVPSAREWLADIVEAVRERRKVQISHKGFRRSRVEEGILLRPYLVKLYRRRWYVVGFNEKVRELRTYALDRIKELRVLTDTFEMPADASTADLFDDIIGISSSKADPRLVRLRVSPEQAKYLRALPLHHSQHEALVADDHSVFEYRLKLNYELVHELLWLGSEVKVLEPRELQVMLLDEINKMKRSYATDFDADLL